MKSIIVTGAAGFVGRAVVLEALKQDYIVYAIVRSISSNRIIDDSRVNYIVCDINEYSKLLEFIGDDSIEAFIHFAWEASAGVDRANKDVQLNNIRCSCDAVEVAAKLGVKRFVFASSIMQYEVEKIMKSQASCNANFQYGIAKMTADYMCRVTANYLGVTYVSALISNIFGVGETSPRLINSSIRKILQGERASFSPGEQMYDFIYISDAARAFLLLAESGINNNQYYIGSQTPKQLKEFLMEMGTVLDRTDLIGLGDFPFNGISLDYDEFDTRKLYDEFGFEQEISFEQGIQLTTNYIREL